MGPLGGDLGCARAREMQLEAVTAGLLDGISVRCKDEVEARTGSL
jgi:hypothetical protein